MGLSAEAGLWKRVVSSVLAVCIGAGLSSESGIAMMDIVMEGRGAHVVPGTKEVPLTVRCQIVYRSLLRRLRVVYTLFSDGRQC